MNNAETKLSEQLTNLKNNYWVKGLKIEFEAEGASFEEAVFLKELSKKNQLDLTIKIGGCEALRDIFDSIKLGAKTIIAPMIETPYALSKFVKSASNIITENSKLYINIETVTGVENFDKIILSENFQQINGIVLGRSDLALSMGLSKQDVNSDKIFEIAKYISLKMKTYNKDFVIGGGICNKSCDFLREIPYLTNFETRKIIFDNDILNSDIAIEGIKKAIEFEIDWLKFKEEKFGIKNKNDIKRIEDLKLLK